MCGIHGITNFGEVDTQLATKVEQMLEKAQHRGPDQKDVVVLPTAVLGMNRLAIVAPDQHSTVQVDEGQQHIVVFNGEIVNYLELFEELSELPAKKSDSALILPLWKKYGADFVKKLAGMFAIALYDTESDELHLWRDPLGVKPLYYAVENNKVIFSSEIKSIYSAMDKKPAVSFTAVDQMLRYRFFPGRETIFPEIKRVFPGEEVTFKAGQVSHRYYWQLTKNVEQTAEAATIENFRKLFKEVVKQNTRGDVSGGYFVSGGLDSSLVTAMGLEEKSNYQQPISIRFTPQAVVDEGYGKRLEKHLGRDFSWVEISDEGARQALEQLVHYMDEPLENPIHIGTYFMAKRANELGVKSVITGDGSDEFFIGYARQACWFLEENPESAYLDWLKTLSLDEAVELYKTEVKALVKPMVDEAGQPIEPFKDIHQVLHFERRERLSEYHCMRLDRMTMAFGVEAKVPFLDHRVAEFAQQISVNDLFGKAGKEWLQEAARPWVPREIIERKKIHFPSLPDQWLSGAGIQWMREILLVSDARINQWLESKVIEKYINEHEAESVKHGRVLWALLTLELWLREVEQW